MQWEHGLQCNGQHHHHIQPVSSVTCNVGPVMFEEAAGWLVACCEWLWAGGHCLCNTGASRSVWASRFSVDLQQPPQWVRPHNATAQLILAFVSQPSSHQRCFTSTVPRQSGAGQTKGQTNKTTQRCCLGAPPPLPHASRWDAKRRVRSSKQRGNATPAAPRCAGGHRDRHPRRCCCCALVCRYVSA